jgi:CRISPR-associated protein Cst2
MSLHIFGAIVTHHGTAANNRAETEGNITTLQKLLWFGRVHSTVSAEAIRFAIRRRLGEKEETNRYWVETGPKARNEWRDDKFERWAANGSYIDDDLLGFMSADAAKEENTPPPADDQKEKESAAPGAAQVGRKPRAKGTANVRRSPLEITRAVSMSPYGGDVTFNAASPGATPSAQKGEKGVKNPVPYGTELHATRYQYGFALTPGSLRKPERARTAIEAIAALGVVAGNHGRFLYDFSPESVVFRITQDPAPRLLYIFEGAGPEVDAPALLARVEAEDLPAGEIIIGGAFSRSPTARKVEALGATVVHGVRDAARLVCDRIAAGEA